MQIIPFLGFPFFWFRGENRVEETNFLIFDQLQQWYIKFFHVGDFIEIDNQ